jgi:hypothetical protein
MGALLAALLALATGARADEPPAALVCLARYYGGNPERTGARWVLALPDGTRIPYDDGRAKSAEERLEHPDVKDLFAVRYHAGPIRPPADASEDPGRARIDALFALAYPRPDTTKIDFLGTSLEVHKKAAPAFARVAARLARALTADPRLGPFLEGLGGTLVVRKIAGTDRQSAHSYGISLDINVERSHYWRWQRPKGPLRWQNRVPQAIVDAFEAEGFIWGGRWYHYDTMHFEYRPELLDPACYGARS